MGKSGQNTKIPSKLRGLTTRHSNLDEARVQLEESLKRCNREDQQFLMDELERLAGVGPGCAPKTVEMVPWVARCSMWWAWSKVCGVD